MTREVRTYWIVVEIATGERRVFRSEPEARACALELGDCEIFPADLWRKSAFLVPARGER